MCCGGRNSGLVTRVSMPRDTDSWIVGENSFKSFPHFGSTIGDYDLTGMK